MRNTSHSLLVTVAQIIKKGGGYWSKAGQLKYTELLEIRHGIKIATRTVRYHFFNQANSGLVKRIRRWGRNEVGQVYNRTTAICLTAAGYKYLYDNGITRAIKYIDRLKKKYGKDSDSAKIPPGEIPGSYQEVPPKKGGKNPYSDPVHRKKIGLPPFPPFKPEAN